MKAIILAAGMGTRLQNLLNGKPKPLLEVGGKSLLEHSIEALVQNGIKDISIVLGYNKEEIIDKIGDNFKGAKITYITNDFYNRTGSMHSLFLAIKEPEDSLVLDGDIIYSKDIIKELINFEKKNVVVLSKCCNLGDDVHVVLDEGKVVYLDKKVPDKPSHAFTGISKFSSDFLKELANQHQKEIEFGNFSDYYEDCALKTSRTLPWHGLITKLPWSEIDTPEHHKYVLENILPRLK